MRAVMRRLTYANVIATLALFLALGGGVVWAAGKVGPGKLRPNSVSAGKIKRNAVTAAKIRPNAVTATKIRDGAVDFTKLAAGTNVIAVASGGPVPAAGKEPVTIPLSGTPTFTPAAGTVDLLSIEAKGDNLARIGEEVCAPTVVPFVNGSPWDIAQGNLSVRAFKADADRPTGLSPVSGGTAPIGLTAPGVTQTVSVKLFGDPNCTAGSTVSVGIAVTQAK
jgi:hypothetical protein